MGDLELEKISIVTYKDKKDDVYISYCPELQLCGYGKSEFKARKSFVIVFKEYLRYTLEKKTLTADLKKHGWKISKKNKKAKPPKISELVLSNEELEKILEEYTYTKCVIRGVVVKRRSQ